MAGSTSEYPLIFSSHVETSETFVDLAENHKILERLVSPHPLNPSASITTLLVELRAPGAPSQTSVRVYSGPDCLGVYQLHASFTMPTESTAEVPRKCLCWTSFPHTKSHLLLCVLLNTSTVAVYDVYPDRNAPENTDNNWTFSLPFECDAIACLPHPGDSAATGSGLLLQRRSDPEDQPKPDDDALFILKSPPNIWSTSQPQGHGSPHPMQQEESLLQVPSLFSLHHPLEDVLPVALQSADSVFDSGQLVTDPFETVLWIGTARWNRQQHSQVLAVTYHSFWKRHAVWAVKLAPPPPVCVPLHQQTAKLMSQMKLSASDDDGSQRQRTLPDAFLFPLAMEVGGYTDMPSAPYGATRQEALADALGIKRTPRASMEPSSVSNHNNLRSRHARSAAGDLFSPLSEPHAALDLSNAGWSAAAAPGAAINSDNNIASDTGTGTGNGRVTEPTDSQGPFASIHPRIAVQCLYTESSNASRPATQIFLATNTKADGELILCLEQPTLGNDNGSGSRVIWLELEPTRDLALQVVQPSGKGLDCISVQPIRVVPIASQLTRTTRPGCMATDILVLASDHRLRLLRATHTIVECKATQGGGLDWPVPQELSDGLENRFTLRRCDATGHHRIFRVQVSLRSSSPMTEKVLLALDAAFATGPWISACPLLALKIRADACRLDQCLRDPSDMAAALFACSDCGWVACVAVILTVIRRELFGSSYAWEPPPTVSTNGAWDLLAAMGPGCENMNFYPAVVAAAHKLQKIGCETLIYLQASQPPSTLTTCIFDSLHMFFEECKLSASSFSFLPRIAWVLLHLCSMGDPSNGAIMEFTHHYHQESGLDSNTDGFLPSSLGSPGIARNRLTSFTAPPCLFSWAEGIFSGRQNADYFEKFTYSDVNASCCKMKAVLRILLLFKSHSRSSYHHHEIVKALLDEGFDRPHLIHEELPPGIALPCLEILRCCRDDLTLAELPGWSAAACYLVGREDLARNISPGPLLPAIRKENTHRDGSLADDDGDGLVPLEQSAAMLFEDNRIHEAVRLLRSSRPLFLRVPRTVETSDHDYERLKQKKLLLLARRSLALPAGRGMISIGSLQHIAAEALPIPELCMKGRVPPTNTTLALDESECPADLRVWPEFHNGVAAGLRIIDSKELEVPISRTWIVYNRPLVASEQQEGDDAVLQSQRQSHAHGGVLMALGLRGHLMALEMSDVYDYLTKGQVTITVGILLGLAANKRGSCDLAVSKMLCLHIPSLIPSYFSAIDVASTVQAAAVTGTGLLYSRSSNRMITEFLVNEIGKRPEVDTSAFDREAYTLSCGIALGMVNLGIGDKNSVDGRAQGLADLRLDERLNSYIKGGIDVEERRRNRETNDRFSLPAVANNGDNERCSTIYEGDQINVDITAPAATLALALMYMRTGNQTIASLLALPDTHFMLEFIRPDFLALRVIARTLILWDEVEPADWIVKEMPSVVSKAYAELRGLARHAMEGGSQGKVMAGYEYDRRAVRQMYVHVVAGACFGLGLRFAGTGNECAKRAISERIIELHALRESNDPVSIASRPDFPILDTALGCAAISLAMVMAGTGDLSSLRLFKVLRWRCEEDCSFGSHMIYGMAIGLLFLGGGTCTLGRDPEDIASLLAAFFPRFPSGTSDNQFHLQATRHLYALAVKRKLLRAVDVDTNDVVSVPAEIRASDGSHMQMLLPCLLKNSDAIVQDLVVAADQYYPLKLNLHRPEQSFTFYVKKRLAESELTLNHKKSSDFGDLLLQAFPEHMVDEKEDKFITFVLDYCKGLGSDETMALCFLSAKNGNPSRRLWDFRLLQAYYDGIGKKYRRDAFNVGLLLSYLTERMERSMLRGSGDLDLVRKYIAIFRDTRIH